MDYSLIVPNVMHADRTNHEIWGLCLEANGRVSLDCHHPGDNVDDDRGLDLYLLRALTWGIPAAVIDTNQLREDLADGGKLATLLDRVHAGHSLVKRFGYLAGKLTNDAKIANEAIKNQCRTYAIN